MTRFTLLALSTLTWGTVWLMRGLEPVGTLPPIATVLCGTVAVVFAWALALAVRRQG
ncbi:MAG: hypothetical protein Q4D79_07530 [Propionibacteriaceae bacterium]|nr:hypothetical protein [Propionibacteriaceae bacterium]